MTSDCTPSENATRVLLISEDQVGPRMAGTGIRNWELARVLAQSCRVVLAAPLSGPVEEDVPWVVRPITLGDGDEMDTLLTDTDVVISNVSALRDYPQLADLPIPWVGDAYVPSATESLPLHEHGDMRDRLTWYAADHDLLNLFLLRADFILCSSERQRDFLLGMLAALGRVNPCVYDESRDLRALIDVVPYGLPPEPPMRRRPVLKGVRSGVAEDDRIILWGGGIWNWFDPLTLIRAVGEIASQHPEVRLFFPGARHPFAERIPEMHMCRWAAELSEELGLTGRHVFFADWLPYDGRADYLLEADIGVSLHGNGIEPRYAYRTRILDYIWAGLPMVVTEGDVLADLVGERGLGYVVPPGDVAAVREAVLALLAEADARGARAAAFREVAQEFSWERVARPLVAFCRDPRLAADKRAGYTLEPGMAWRDALRLRELEELVAAYERGRFMRIMAVLKRWRHRLFHRRGQA